MKRSCFSFTTFLSCRCYASMHTLRKTSCTPLRKTTACAPWSFTTTSRMTACASLSPGWRILGYRRGNGSNASVCPRMNEEIITSGKTSTWAWTWRCTGSSTTSRSVTLLPRYNTHLCESSVYLYYFSLCLTQKYGSAVVNVLCLCVSLVL